MSEDKIFIIIMGGLLIAICIAGWMARPPMWPKDDDKK
jgi:hypothetical protein